MTEDSETDSERSNSISEFDGEIIFDENSQKLICIGTNFDVIPPSIIDEYAHRTKVKKKQQR